MRAVSSWVCRAQLPSARRSARAATFALLAAVSLVRAPLLSAADAPPRAAAPVPALAPAPTPSHGHRAKAGDGTALVFDGVFGAYTAPGQPRTYWAGDRFYRYQDGAWLGASALSGPWDLAPSELVPLSLRKGFPPPKTRVRTKLPSGLDLVYEPGLRSFTVVGQPDVYVFEGRFLRHKNGVWLASSHQDGPWQLAPMKGLPLLLRRKVKPPVDGARVSLPSGQVLEYDTGLAVFRAADKPDLYFRDGVFFERRDSKWFQSTGSEAGVEEIAISKVPPALRNHYRRVDGPGGAAEVEKKDGAEATRAAQPARGKAAKAPAAGAGSGTARKKAGAEPMTPTESGAGNTDQGAKAVDSAKPGHGE